MECSPGNIGTEAAEAWRRSRVLSGSQRELLVLYRVARLGLAGSAGKQRAAGRVEIWLAERSH